MEYLRQNSAVSVILGPFVSYLSGATNIDSVSLLAGVTAALLRANSGTTVNLANNSWELISGSSGNYRLGLSTTNTATTGAMRVSISGASLSSKSFLEVWKDFMVVTQNFYDGMFGIAPFQVSATTLGATAVSDSGVTMVYTSSGTTVAKINSGVTLTTGVSVGKIISGVTLPEDQSSVTIGWVISGATTTFLGKTRTSDSGVTIVSNADKTGYTVSTLSDKSGITVGWMGATAVSDSGVTIAAWSGTSVSSSGVTTWWIANTAQSDSGVTTSVADVTVSKITSDVTLATGVTVTKLGSTFISDSGVTVVSNADKTGYTVDTINDKTGYSLSADQSSVSIGYVLTGVTVSVLGNTHISDSGVTIVSNTDKTGYTVSTLSDKSGITVGWLGATAVSDSGVTVVSNADKTGYSISGTSTTLDDLNDINAEMIWSVAGGRTITGGVSVTNITSGVTLSTGVTTEWLSNVRVADSGVTVAAWSGTSVSSSGVTTRWIADSIQSSSGVTVAALSGTSVSDSGVTVAGQSGTFASSGVTISSGVSNIFNAEMEGGHSLRNILRILLSVLSGKSTGGGTATVAFRDVGDTKDRVSVTVDADGNRTAVGTRDGT